MRGVTDAVVTVKPHLEVVWHVRQQIEVAVAVQIKDGKRPFTPHLRRVPNPIVGSEGDLRHHARAVVEKGERQGEAARADQVDVAVAINVRKLALQRARRAQKTGAREHRQVSEARPNRALALRLLV